MSKNREQYNQLLMRIIQETGDKVFNEKNKNKEDWNFK